MHITITHTTLKEMLDLVSRISTKHITLPILQCVIISAKKDEGVHIRATNLEIGIEGTIPAKVIEEGEIAVNAQTLLQIISLISQKEVELYVTDGLLTIKTPTSKSSINISNANDFPTIPQVENDGITINGKNFAHGIKTAAFAASPSSIKPELGSVYVFQKKEHSLTFVATDSFRLVEKTVPMQGLVFDKGILIPYKNALELARVCDLYEEEPELIINENQCVLKFKQVTITSRLTAGNFPDYEQIIPKEYSVHITLLTNDLVSALRKTNIFLNKFMQLSLIVAEGTLTLSSKGDVGTTEEKVTISQEGNDISLNINQKYLQEILGHVQDDSIVIHFTGLGRPLVLESVYNKSLRYLIMPMNR